ncbi:hypothetical protein ACLKA6_007720 [Drosophila palustris]
MWGMKTWPIPAPANEKPTARPRLLLKYELMAMKVDAIEHRAKPKDTSTQPVAATFRGLKLLMAGPMNKPEKLRAKLFRFVISAAVNVSSFIR